MDNNTVSIKISIPPQRNWKAEIKTSVANNNFALFSDLIHGWCTALLSSSTHPAASDLFSIALCIARKGVTAEFLEVLHQAGWNVFDSFTPKTSTKSLFLKSSIRDKSLMEWLLKHGLNQDVLLRRSNTWDTKNISALIYSAYYSPPSVLELLISHNASITGSRALTAAVLSRSSNWQTKVDALLVAGADINALDFELPWLMDRMYTRPTETGTPAHWAAYWGFLDRVEGLVERGADLEVKDGEGNTVREVGEMAARSDRLYRGWSRKWFSKEALQREEDRVQRALRAKEKEPDRNRDVG